MGGFLYVRKESERMERAQYFFDPVNTKARASFQEIEIYVGILWKFTITAVKEDICNKFSFFECHTFKCLEESIGFQENLFFLPSAFHTQTFE